MKKTEKENDKNKNTGAWPNMSCCGTDGSRGAMPDCWRNTGETDDCRSMMSKCMTVCRWFPLIPVVLGTALLLLGYYLDAEMTRVLWMLAAGFVAAMGVLGLLAAGRMKKLCCG